MKRSISDICLDGVGLNTDVDEKAKDPITFAESSWGINLKFTPIQKVIVKLFYAVPLSDDEKNIIIYDKFLENELYRFNELEYVKFLYEEGRLNQKAEDVLNDKKYQLILPLGRRGSKTFLAAFISVYESYKLLLKHNPQKFYKLVDGDTIQMTSVATGRDQASLLFNFSSSFFRACNFFQPFVANSTQSYVALRTKNDIEK